MSIAVFKIILRQAKLNSLKKVQHFLFFFAAREAFIGSRILFFNNNNIFLFAQNKLSDTV